MRDTTFVHLSDLHVGPPGPGDPALLSDTGATLAAVVAEVEGLPPPPRFAAVSGDLAHRGDADSYRTVRDGVAAILCGHVHQDRVAVWEGVPVVTASGQHATKDPLHGDGLRSVRGASLGLCRPGPSGSSVTSVQMPSDRTELEPLPEHVVRTFA